VKDTKNPADRPPARKKPYASPRLISYGHVKDIVQGDTGPMTGDGQSTTKPCWVAEALYGPNDCRTLVLRDWLSAIHVQRRRGWRFVALYITYGRGVAAALERGLVLRTVLRPLFDVLAHRAFTESARRLAARSGLRT
jgi:hypothetical protein